jgi:hypothetical protein
MKRGRSHDKEEYVNGFVVPPHADPSFADLDIAAKEPEER